jgi:hypothetical protein
MVVVVTFVVPDQLVPGARGNTNCGCGGSYVDEVGVRNVLLVFACLSPSTVSHTSLKKEMEPPPLEAVVDTFRFHTGYVEPPMVSEVCPLTTMTTLTGIVRSLVLYVHWLPVDHDGAFCAAEALPLAPKNATPTRHRPKKTTSAFRVRVKICLHAGDERVTI